jgi:dTDP-4-dehydrorhamnose 3,5-epimerase
MKITKTDIPDLILIEPKIFEDTRGYFFEAYNSETFKQSGIDQCFVQDNQSKSSFGVIRGLHYQLEPYAQTKLVRVLEGEIFDVAVDLRKDSPSFGKWWGVNLNSELKNQFLIPKGFAHGFSVLSETAIILYKCDAVYNKESERGIIYNDLELNIDWKIPQKDVILSERDKTLPSFKMAEKNFSF